MMPQSCLRLYRLLPYIQVWCNPISRHWIECRLVVENIAKPVCYYGWIGLDMKQPIRETIIVFIGTKQRATLSGRVKISGVSWATHILTQSGKCVQGSHWFFFQFCFTWCHTYSGMWRHHSVEQELFPSFPSLTLTDRQEKKAKIFFYGAWVWGTHSKVFQLSEVKWKSKKPWTSKLYGKKREKPYSNTAL